MGGYTRVGSLHKFRIGTPRSCQIEKVSTETPPLYVRSSGIRINSMGFTQEVAGFGRYTMNLMGSGRELQTSLDPTPTDDGFEAASYFNGSISKNGLALSSATAFSLTLGNAVSRQEALFNQGIASGINPGNFTIEGNLGLIYEDLDFYNQAVNEDIITLECMWTNKPIDLATSWLRVLINAARLSRGTPRMGGNAGLTVTQRFRGQKPLLGFLPEVFSSVGPFNIVGPAINLGIKVDGGGTITKVLTAGATRTAAQVVADIGSIAGGVAEVWNGRVRIKSSTPGALGSIAIDTTVANSAHAALGFDAVVRTGYPPTACVVEWFNGLSTDYA
jgi:hypothetical protein